MTIAPTYFWPLATNTKARATALVAWGPGGDLMLPLWSAAAEVYSFSTVSSTFTAVPLTVMTVDASPFGYGLAAADGTHGAWLAANDGALTYVPYSAPAAATTLPSLTSGLSPIVGLVT
jgi:hypothetical protein